MSATPAAANEAAIDPADSADQAASVAATAVGLTDAAVAPTADVSPASEVTCPRCDGPFVCGANASSCWCQTLPTLDLARRPAALVGHGCLCGGCLGAAVAEQLAA